MASILIVDDSSDEAELGRMMLGERGHAVSVALGGPEAIQALKTAPPPDVMLLDLKMPGMDGLGVIAWARAQPALETLPIVVFTCSDHPGDIGAARQAGADDYICKPVDLKGFDEVARKLEAIVAARKA